MNGLVPEPQVVAITCADGVVLGGHLWRSTTEPAGIVTINPATGVLSRYYRFYAQFLAEHGFDVITFDYRGIGNSRPARLRGCGYRWHDWGELDFEAVLGFAAERSNGKPLHAVGHSIGGFLPGLAQSAHRIQRMLTVGAQYAYWRDYAPGHRLRLFAKWHVAMPLLTAICGYFPGKRMGWLEDLPAGVANEWTFRHGQMELSHPEEDREHVRDRFSNVSASILAVVLSDDEIGTAPAIRRTLNYYVHAIKTEVFLSPSDFGEDSIGHFGLFHSRFAATFWRDSLLWLREGINPWPGLVRA